MRATKGAARRRAKKRVLKAAEGYWGGRRKMLRTATETLVRARAYAFRGRRERKRDFRALWITRISAAARACGITYNRLIEGLTKAKVALNRKMLAELALNDAKAFEELVGVARKQLQPA